MRKIINWSIKDEKVILNVLDEDSGKIENIPLTDEIYNEIISSGPPTEDKKIRDLIEEIHKIREKRILYIDKILEMEEELINDMEKIKDEIHDARKELKDCKEKLEVSIWKGVLDSCNAELQIVTKTKSVLQEYRHLIKLTHQEEGKLSLELRHKLGS